MLTAIYLVAISLILVNSFNLQDLGPGMPSPQPLILIIARLTEWLSYMKQKEPAINCLLG